ncbi:MAG TPA: hypothetical protein VEF34_13440, partial [Syntrophobacteraceae bacterium]|nr:hypothetical protein [Syntrophobacteraceae bacterium]
VAAGLLTGLAFLTKVEIFLALFCAVGAALIAAHLLRRSRTSTSLKAALVLSASATIPPVIGMLWLVPALGPGGALKGVTGSFYYLITNSEISKLPFYVKRMGADDIGGNLMRMFKAAAVTAGLVAGAGTLGILFRYTKRRHAAIPAAVFIVFGLVFRFAFRFEWLTSIARPFPLFMLIIAATLVLTIVKHSRRPKERGNGRGGCALSRREIENKIEGSRSDLRAVDKLGFVVFSFLLLGKMILSSRIDGYGFVLAMPAAMTLTLLIDDWLPRWVTEKGGVGAVTRAAGVAVLAVVVGGFILVGNSHIAKKTAQVTNGSDTVLTYQSGAVINEGLSTLRTLIRPGETIAVFPEGVMLNYLMRVENPTPYVSYLPPEVSMFGEKAMLAAFKVHPPDYIVAVPRSFREYGVRGFGQGYAEELASWIVGNYQEIKTIMPEATRQAPLGKLFILRRKDRLH